MVQDYLSGWFCFVQSSEGQVVSVFHSRDEDVEAVNLKKSIAAAFQANFRGTEQEIEIDPQSKHVSHTVKNKVCIAHHIWCVQHVSIRTPYLVCYAHLPLAHHFGCA